MIENPIILQSNHARYDDESYSTVTIEWVSKEDGKLRTHTVPADPNNADYRDLMEHHGWTEEDLLKQTAVWKKQQSRAFNMTVQKMAENIAEEAIERRVAAKVEQLNEKLSIATRDMTEADRKNLEAEQRLRAVKVTVDNAFWDKILEQNENKDEVFKFKLWALELDKVKESTAEQKKELRKQETLFSCFTVFNSIINN